MKNAVVIGAGQTGRGYIPRFLFENGNYTITLIDQNQELIQTLQEDKAYCIHFYSKDRTPLYIHSIQAHLSHSKEAIQAIREADFVFTSVGEQNLYEVASQLQEGMQGKEKLTKIVTAENGINPGKVLRKYMEEQNIQAPYLISMTAVFCSTVKLDKTRLDILSMNEYYFPFDCDALDELDFKGAVPIHNFEKFLKRKIYTYNCLAGLISYCGYVKGYEVYGDAANDEDISQAMDTLLLDLNPVLQDYFEITKEDQEEFADRAMKKMKNKDILDFNVKNGRAPRRKLGPTERIMSPLAILKDHGKDFTIMEFVAAAALVYWMELQGKSEPLLEKTPIETFCEINNLELNNPIVKDVQYFYDKIMENRDCVQMMDLIQEYQICKK
ncbi:MAG: NAD(P)-binding domain-containing protein [Floccifex sp.]